MVCFSQQWTMKSCVMFSSLQLFVTYCDHTLQVKAFAAAVFFFYEIYCWNRSAVSVMDFLAVDYWSLLNTSCSLFRRCNLLHAITSVQCSLINQWATDCMYHFMYVVVVGFIAHCPTTVLLTAVASIQTPQYVWLPKCTTCTRIVITVHVCIHADTAAFSCKSLLL
jgi:hypothetical protein